MCPFSISNPRKKKRKKAFSCEAAADLPSSDKGSFLNQDEWLQEIEEHERKPGTSEKQSDLLTWIPCSVWQHIHRSLYLFT